MLQSYSEISGLYQLIRITLLKGQKDSKLNISKIIFTYTVGEFSNLYKRWHLKNIHIKESGIEVNKNISPIFNY